MTDDTLAPIKEAMDHVIRAQSELNDTLRAISDKLILLDEATDSNHSELDTISEKLLDMDEGTEWNKNIGERLVVVEKRVTGIIEHSLALGLVATLLTWFMYLIQR